MATLNFIPESRQVISAMEGVIEYCLQESKIVDDTLASVWSAVFLAMERMPSLSS